MSFPWIFQSNFEGGVSTEWDSTTGSLVSFPHYSTLSQIPGLPAPYEGAYCMMVDLRGGTTSDQTVTEGDCNIADTATGYYRFALYASPDFTATADDTFSILELQQDGATVEMTLGMRITAASNALEIGIGDGTAPTSFVTFPRGRWVVVELLVTVSTNDAGVLTLFLDGGQAATLTGLDHAAGVGLAVLGTQLTLSTTRGILLFDDFIMDDARIYPPNQRFPQVQRLTKSGHAFVGPGSIESAFLLSDAGTMDVYDTDTANTNDASAKKIELDASGNFVGTDAVTRFERGCYVVLAGTNPYGEVRLSRSAGQDCGPTAYGSDGAIRTYAARRTPRLQNV